MKKIYLLVIAVALSTGQLFSQTITVTGALAAFEKCNGSASTSESFAVEGASLNDDIEIAALAGLEYSIDDVTFFMVPCISWDKKSIPTSSHTPETNNKYLSLNKDVLDSNLDLDENEKAKVEFKKDPLDYIFEN